MQQNIQTELNFSSTSAGEAREAGRGEDFVRAEFVAGREWHLCDAA